MHMRHLLGCDEEHCDEKCYESLENHTMKAVEKVKVITCSARTLKV